MTIARTHQISSASEEWLSALTGWASLLLWAIRISFGQKE